MDITDLMLEIGKLKTDKKEELHIIVGLLQSIRDECPIDYTIYLKMLDFIQNQTK